MREVFWKWFFCQTSPADALGDLRDQAEGVHEANSGPHGHAPRQCGGSSWSGNEWREVSDLLKKIFFVFFCNKSSSKTTHKGPR
jgi:hypothetical protein